MDEMLCYIFGELQNSKTAMAKVQKALRHQKRVNTRLTILALAAVTYFVIARVIRIEV